MSHAATPLYHFATASQPQLAAQTRSHGRLPQQADDPQPHRGLGSMHVQADTRHLATQGYARATKVEEAIYQPLYPQYTYDASNEISDTQPRSAEQSRLGASAPLFFSQSPRHFDIAHTHLQRHYDDTRHAFRVQQHESIAPQYATSLENFEADNTTMSLSYETRQYPEYPQSTLMHDPHHQEQEEMQHHRYPSPPPPLSDTSYSAQATLEAAAALIDAEIPELPQKEESDAQSPGRSKPIPKPPRTISKDAEGRFLCNWSGCTEEVRSFNRKCEWSKHMDKHDRPYKCPAEGCEKLPGFTYSGGLLRHQREVHNLHGGPRKQLNCPHPTCKRYTGKGFSRQENLNEHLRRVHTDGTELPPAEETETETERAGMKRKRGSTREDDSDLRQELARLRQENEDMKRTTENLMRQLQSLQGIVGSSIQRAQLNHQAPAANML